MRPNGSPSTTRTCTGKTRSTGGETNGKFAVPVIDTGATPLSVGLEVRRRPRPPPGDDVAASVLGALHRLDEHHRGVRSRCRVGRWCGSLASVEQHSTPTPFPRFGGSPWAAAQQRRERLQRLPRKRHPPQACASGAPFVAAASRAVHSGEGLCRVHEVLVEVLHGGEGSGIRWARVGPEGTESSVCRYGLAPCSCTGVLGHG